MTKTNLTDHQRCVLHAASQSANLNAWPLPQRLGLSKGSATIVMKGLLKKGLIEERAALGHDAIWREAEDGRPVALIITKAGLAAVGMLPEVAGDGKQAADHAAQKAHDEAECGPTAPVSQNQQRRPRAGSKLAALVGLLEQDGGATVDEMAAALGWQQHTIRGVMSGALTNRFGLTVTSEKISERGRVYYIRDAAGVDAYKVGSR
jgi:predicted ArsR family transcriptional regulator